jgi:hypothetical protein
MDALQGQLDANRDEFIATGRETTRLKNQLNELQRSGVSRTSDQYVAVQKAYNESFRKEARIEEAKDAIARKMVDLQASINTVSIRIAKAEGGIPDTNTTPRPASDQPGSNTTPEPDVITAEDIPQQQKVIDDPNAALADAQDNLGAIAVPPQVTEEPTYPEVDELGIPIQDPPPIDEPILLGELGINTDQINTAALGELGINTDLPQSTTRGLPGQVTQARQQATAQDKYNYGMLRDWRVKLSLAPNSSYLYNASTPGILAPLKATGGVVFPYTPSIQVGYSATYSPTELVHNNFKMQNYMSSSVDNISLTGEFTAQDTGEANYVLAVIHFFKSVTKMFYGQDSDPKPGTPPPMCFLTGLGSYQFDKEPLVITNFTYSLPTDVDYIRATSTSDDGPPAGSSNSGQAQPGRMGSTSIGPGGTAPQVQWSSVTSNTKITYVPTKIQIQVQAVPAISRGKISNNFSLRDYASGKLTGFF